VKFYLISLLAQLLYLTEPHLFGAAVRANVIIVTLRFVKLNLFRHVGFLLHHVHSKMWFWCLNFVQELSVSTPLQNTALRYAIISSRFWQNLWNFGTAIQQLRKRVAAQNWAAHGTRHSAPAGCCMVHGMHHHNVNVLSDAHLRFICWRYHNSNCIL
jgi:hypothetical protein